MIKLELVAEDRGPWRSRVVVSVMPMRHYHRWHSASRECRSTSNDFAPAKGNQEVDLGKKEPIVDAPEPGTGELVRLQVMPGPYEGGTPAAREPEETQNDDSIERRKPATFPADKPFGKMYMNHIVGLEEFLLGAGADLDTAPHYFAEEQQQRRISVSLSGPGLISTCRTFSAARFLTRLVRSTCTLSGLDCVRMGESNLWFFGWSGRRRCSRQLIGRAGGSL